MPYSTEQLTAAFAAPTDHNSQPDHRGSAGHPLAVGVVKEIRSALSFIPAQERDVWLQVGMALHATGAGQQAFGLWDEWSRLTDRSNYDPEDQRRVWNSFGKRTGPQIMLGTLFDLAKATGWARPGEPPTSAKVEDISGENERRLAFEARINESNDFAEIVYVIVPEIKRAGLRAPSLELLLKKAAKQAGIPVKALHDPPSSGGEAGAAAEHDDRESARLVEELNARHAVVPIGGKVHIMNEEVDVELNRRVITYSTRTDFILRYENRLVWKNRVPIDVGSHWLRSPQRRQYDGVTFAPGRDVPPGYYNLWQGWAVPPDPNPSCQRYLDFIAEVICDGNVEAIRYVWGWMCHLFQRPWEVPGTALVLRGVPGTGKNTFVGPLSALVGAHYIELSNVDQLVGRFSGHMAEKLLVFANEAIWGGDKSAEGTLKALISDSQSAVESKHRDIISRANYKRTIIASNEQWCAPKGRYDRRLAVLDVSPKRRGQRAYFEAIRAEMRKGGLRRLLHEMQKYDLSRFNVDDIPRCLREAGWDMALASMRSVEKWWVEVVARGYLYYDQSAFNDERAYEWPAAENAERVRSAYLHWCQRNRESYVEGAGPFGKWLADFGCRNRLRRKNGHREHWYVFPPVEEAQRILSEMYSIPDAYWDPPSDED